MEQHSAIHYRRVLISILGNKESRRMVKQCNTIEHGNRKEIRKFKNESHKKLGKTSDCVTGDLILLGS